MENYTSLHQRSTRTKCGCAAGRPPRTELGGAGMGKGSGGSPRLSARHCCFVLFLCCSFPWPVASQGAAAAADANEERQVLLQMKEEWGNPTSLSSWTPSSSPCSGTWNGVACGGDGPSVTAVTLIDQGIEGGVPNVTCRLGNLSTLNLFNNSVGGTFPTALYDCTSLRSLNLSQNLFVGKIPADIDRLANLTALDLSYNNFSGDVLMALARISGLRQLRLDNNLFDGTFPRELGSLAALENLTLAYNPFWPTRLPAEFGKLTRLKYLFLAEANLVGDIPESLGNLTDLEHLDLAGNQLNGTIPSRIWQLEKLQFVYLYHNKLSGTIAGPVAASGLKEIDLSMNELSGTIPDEFGKQPNLRVLYLYNNRFSGEIPGGIARIPTLTDIRLFTNNLMGTLPPELGKYSKLENLEVNNNGLSGELPASLCAGAVLDSLVVFNNSFTGGLPRSLGDCPSLRTLRVHSNRLSGEVPAGIWSLPKLTTVIMNGNMLSGELPESLPPYLARLDIRDNGFAGRIPSSSPSLQTFWASNNLLSGEIPSELKGMSKLLELFLDQNRVYGEIPAGIGSLRLLTSLNLSANLLTGSIPGAVASLPVLTYLDLSENRLSGEIPTALGSLRFSFLNLSSNLLTGVIPPVLQNQAYDRSFLSNPGLCSSNSFLNLPPCGARPHSSSDGLAKGLLTLFLVLGILVLLFISLVGFFVAWELRRRKKGAGDVASWKLTSFQSVDFEESNILRGLTSGNLVGSGGSGEVYRVPLGNRAGEVVAVKKIWSRKHQDAEVDREFEAEVRILGSVRHANIVKLLCCISSADSELLVYEYMEKGSLDLWLHGKRSTGGCLDWPARLGIAVGAARGLSYMHHDCRPPIVHRDVKSSNILLDSGLRAKVADFGLARMLLRPGVADTVSTVAGSIGYMAPECGYSRKVNEKVDVYSFGVVLLELATGRRANEGDGRGGGLAEWARRHMQEDGSVEAALDERITDPLHVEEMSVVLRLGLFCTGRSPSTRPSMKEVLQVLLRCAQRHGEGHKPGRELDVAPLLQEKRQSESDDGQEDEESSLACSV